MADPTIIQTTTDELYLPTRLVYTVRKAEVLRRWFQRHPALTWDSAGGRWTWNHHRKLRWLDLPKAYAEAILRQGGLVMASCYLVNAKTLHVYVRSVPRALYFLRFFDREVPHDVAMGEFVDGYNLVITAKDVTTVPTPEDYFADERKVHYVDSGTVVDQCKTPSARERLGAELDTDRIQPLERHRLDSFYTNGLAALQQAMQFRETLAMLKHESPNPDR